MKLNLLDELFSELIRKRAIKNTSGCERCLTQKNDLTKENGSIFPAWKQLQCSHFWGRIRKSTRWDEDDVAGLCGACHIYFEQHPAEHTKFFKKRLGVRAFENLEIRAHMPQKLDINALTIYLRLKIKELDEKD